MAQQQTFCLGIDIGKYHHQATLIDQKQQVIGQSLRFDNSLAGFDLLRQTIKKQLPKSAMIKVGMEATGHYYWHLKNYLFKNGFNQCHLFNPIVTQQLSKTNIRKVKNDKADSLLIAKLVSRQSDNQINIIAENNDLKQLKELTRFCEKLKSQKRFYQQELSVLMERICPEFQACFSHLFLKTPMAIIKHYFLDKLKLEQLIKAAVKTSRGRLTTEKAQMIIEVLNNSLGKDFRHQYSTLQLKMLLESLDLVEKQIKEMKDQIEKKSQTFKEIEYLDSIPGISNYLASVILSEINDINKFERKEQLTAFAGLDASVKESGQYQRKQGNHISKRGSKYLRKQLYYAAKTAIIFDPELKAFYQKKKAQGKHYNVIIIAVARKILMRCFAVLKQKRPYQLRPNSPIFSINQNSKNSTVLSTSMS